MAYTPTGRSRGRPKTKEYGTIAVRVPADLIEKVKKYASVHRCSVSELIRDGLEMRLESGEVPGRSVWLAQDNGETPPGPYTCYTVLHDMFPMLHAAIAAAVRETIQAVLTPSHGEHGNSVIQQDIPVLQQDTGSQSSAGTGESQHGAEPMDPESADTPEETTNYHQGKLCLTPGHAFRETGTSWRRNNNGRCWQCDKAAKRLARARQKAAQVQEG